MSDGWIKVADADEVPAGSVKGVEAGGSRIALCNGDGDCYAIKDQCSHQDYPLSDGELDGERLECIYHGARFDVCTGKAVQLPAVRPVETFDVEARDDGVFVRVA